MQSCKPKKKLNSRGHQYEERKKIMGKNVLKGYGIRSMHLWLFVLRSSTSTNNCFPIWCCWFRNVFYILLIIQLVINLIDSSSIWFGQYWVVGMLVMELNNKNDNNNNQFDVVNMVLKEVWTSREGSSNWESILTVATSICKISNVFLMSILTIFKMI